MKYLLALLFLLASISASFAQAPSKALPATAAAQTNPVEGLPPSTDTTSKRKELDYYKNLAAQAKSEADGAHNDIMVGYGVNLSAILLLVAVVVCYQYVNVKAELRKSKRQVLRATGRMNTALASLRTENAELISTHKRELEAGIKNASQSADRVHAHICGYAQSKDKLYFNARRTFLDIATKELEAGEISIDTGLAIQNCVNGIDEIQEHNYEILLTVKSFFKDAKGPVYPVLHHLLSAKPIYRNLPNSPAREYINNPPKQI
jgi:hypothetical protein